MTIETATHTTHSNTHMEFPAEVWQLIANQLSPTDCLQLCLSSKQIRTRLSLPDYLVYRRRYRELIRDYPDLPLFRRHLRQKTQLYQDIVGKSRLRGLERQLRERFGVLLLLGARYGKLDVVRLVLETVREPFDVHQRISVFLWALENVDGETKDTEVAEYLYQRWKDKFGDFFGVLLVHYLDLNDMAKLDMLFEIYGDDLRNDKEFLGFELGVYVNVNEDGSVADEGGSQTGSITDTKDFARELLLGSDASDSADDDMDKTVRKYSVSMESISDRDSYFGESIMDWVLHMTEPLIGNQFLDKRLTMDISLDDDWDSPPPTWKAVLLCEAVSRRNLPMVAYLIRKRRAPVNASGTLSLFLAIQNHDTPMIRYLLDNGADPNSNHFDTFRDVIKSGDLQLVRAFIDAKADVEESDALVTAITIPLNNLAMVRLLIEHGRADPRSCGNRPLIRAALHNDVPLCEYLLSKGADIHCRDDQILWFTSGMGSYDALVFLFSRGATYKSYVGHMPWHDVNVDDDDDDNDNATMNAARMFGMSMASELDYFNTVRLLLERNVKPRQMHERIFQVATVRRMKSVLKLLISADPEYFHSRVERMDPSIFNQMR